jgi:hypothetical protein
MVAIRKVIPEKELVVIQKYLNGDDVNNDPIQKASRFIINLKNNDLDFCKDNFPNIIKHLELTTKLQRAKVKRDVYRNIWWQFAEKCARLYDAIHMYGSALVITQVTKYANFALVDKNQVFDQRLTVIALDKSAFCVLQSVAHEIWAWKYGSTLGGSTLTYNSTKIFQTFPFPQNHSLSQLDHFDRIGESYHEHRKQLMLAIQLGLTKTYNLFHAQPLRLITPEEEQFDDKTLQKLLGKDAAHLRKHLAKTPGTITFNEAVSAIQKLRNLHHQMDNAVLEAYGWSDINLRHNFYEVEYLPENDRIRYTIHPAARREILKRLLELNHEVHKQEVVAGLWEKKGENNEKIRKKLDATQIDLGI